VQVKADKEVYKVREKASVQVKVARADGAPLPAGAEVALAAVDVGLLELMPNTSWELLEAMMQQRNLRCRRPPRRCRWSANATSAARPCPWRWRRQGRRARTV
jgi:outer membrane usher protein FimD/PapC